MKARYLLAGLALLAVAAVGLRCLWFSGRSDASALLLRSAEKTHNINYTGVVQSSLSYYGKQIDTLMRVYHKGSGDRMEYLSTPLKGAVVVGTGTQTYTYHPQSGKLMVSPDVARSSEVEKVRLLLRNYRAETAGRDTVAGRSALVVDVVPKRQGNPSKRVWIDEKTLLVLKQEDRSASGTLKSSMTFKEVSYPRDIPQEKFALPAQSPSGLAMKVNQPMEHGNLSKQLGFEVTKPGYIPPGYTFAGYQLYRCRCFCKHNAAHLRYTDGLNSVSIFQVPPDVKCAGSHCKMHKKMASNCEVGDCKQAQVGRVNLKDKNVIVVADLPQEEIERIARSIK